jgi:hypothetical protein
MRRFTSTLVVAAMAVALLTGTGCQKKIEVQSGTRTVCTYGEVVSNDVKTVSVAADKAGGYRVRTVTVTCDRHKKLEALYAEAQKDIASGDLKAAKLKLTQVLASDSAFRSAREQLRAINSGKKPTPDTGSKPDTSKPTTSTPKPGDDQPTGPIQSMMKWAPDTITGFAASKTKADSMSLSRQYVPAAGSKAVALVIVAEQFRDAAAANAALKTQVKLPYSNGASTVTVNKHSVYIGTDSTRYAILAFTQGAVLVQVEMASKPGAQTGLKDALIAVGKQLP